MVLNNQTVNQDPLFSELSDEGDVKNFFQILVSRKYYLN